MRPPPRDDFPAGGDLHPEVHCRAPGIDGHRDRVPQRHERRVRSSGFLVGTSRSGRVEDQSLDPTASKDSRTEADVLASYRIWYWYVQPTPTILDLVT